MALNKRRMSNENMKTNRRQVRTDQILQSDFPADHRRSIQDFGVNLNTKSHFLQSVFFFFANECKPLVIRNQYGFKISISIFILTNQKVSALCWPQFRSEKLNLFVYVFTKQTASNFDEINQIHL